nr:uncharacterized protein LOC126526716 [Dermacentor andersoni]
MAHPLLLFVQVGPQCTDCSYRSDNKFLVILPCPRKFCCILIDRWSMMLLLVSGNIEENSGMNKEMHELVIKVDDMENRSRRNNLVIYGVTEDSDEEARTLENKIKEGIFKDILALEVKSIERIHRIGNRYGQRPRPIILRLFDCREKNKILSCCNKLKGTPISISEDFSKRIRDIRSNLWRSTLIGMWQAVNEASLRAHRFCASSADKRTATASRKDC